MTASAHSGTPAAPGLTVLDAADVERLLDWAPLLDVVEAALTESGPSGSGIQVPVGAGALHVKCGNAAGHLSVKANLRGVVPGVVSGVLVLFDLDRAVPAALVDSGSFTAVRTAAVAAVAARRLGPARPVRVAVIGVGAVGRRCLEALPHAIDVAGWSLWNRSPVSQSTLRAIAPITLHGSPAAAVAGCDLVITCTAATSPVLSRVDLAPSATILAMGADTPGKQELSADLLTSSRLVVDSEEALQRGEAAHLAPPTPRPPTLAEVLAGAVRLGRQENRRTVFDSVGSPAVDARASAWLVNRAQRRGVGRTLELTQAPAPDLTE